MIEFLLVIASSAISFIFISVSIFTPDWVSLSSTGGGYKTSSGIFPWVCVSHNTCNAFWHYASPWQILFFLSILFAWILQLLVLLEAIITQLIRRFRVRLMRWCMKQQILITFLLLFTLIGYGVTYGKNKGIYDNSGEKLSLGASYWLCLVSTICSMASVVLGAKAFNKAEQLKKSLATA